MKKNCRKQTRAQDRKSNKKSDKLHAKWKGYDLLNSQIDKKDIIY